MVVVCVSHCLREREHSVDLIRNVLWFLSIGFSVEVLTRCYVFKYYVFGAKRCTVAISAIAMTAASRVNSEPNYFFISNAFVCIFPNEKNACVISELHRFLQTNID